MLRSSNSTVLMATDHVNRKCWISTPVQNQLCPSTDRQKMVTGDINNWGKFGANPSTGASGHMGEIQQQELSSS